jgi:hypothetical protein
MVLVPLKRTRHYRKRAHFKRLPLMARPVKTLWEEASAEDQTRAHQTCVLMLEYWLGRRTKAEMVELLGMPPLRVWQLSQQALAGMLAGLLKQPRARGRRLGRPPMDNADELKALRKRVTEQEKEIERLRKLLEVLRDLPLARTVQAQSEPPSERKKKKRVVPPSDPKRDRPPTA